MSDREILVGWLAAVAARLRWRARLHELARLGCALLALLFAWQALAAAGAPAPVRAALLPLFLLGALALTAWFGWRLRGSTTLEQAAAEADASAGLQDEIRSAHWFAAEREREGRGRAEELIGLLLARAARSVQRLDTRRLIPLRMPRSALGALALAAGTAGLIWLSPHLASSPASALAQSQKGAVRNPGRADLLESRSVQPVAVGVVAPERAEQGDGQAAAGPTDQRMQPDAAADRQAPEAAEGTPDAALAAHAAQARDAAAAPAPVRLSKLDISALVQAGVADAQQEAGGEPGRPGQEPHSGSFPSPMARMTREMREQIRAERRKLEGTPAQGEVEYNPRMRAMRRNSSGANELVEARGQAADAGDQTSVDGDAKGSPEGKARAGGTSGEHPESSQISELDTQPVLGERTDPLRVQTEQVPVDRAGEMQAGAAKESFYAATRRRAAQTSYQAVDAGSATQQEAALAPGDTPLSYREAVKRYFLTQHARQE
jgi:hypothetical protein